MIEENDTIMTPENPTEPKTTFPKLLVIDLDGTVLGGDHQPYARLPKSVAAFLDSLVEAGCDWAINTTWDIKGQWQLILASPVKSRPRYLIGEFGRRVASIGADGPEFVQPYTKDTDALAELAAGKSLAPMLKDLCNLYTPKKLAYYGHLLSFDASVNGENFERDMLKRYGSMEGIILSIKGSCLSATLDWLNKGRGLAEVIRVGGYDPAEIVVAGDETADIKMMCSQYAAHALCPSNSHPEVKKHVEAFGGIVSPETNGAGVIDGFGRLAAREGWTIPGTSTPFSVAEFLSSKSS